MEEGHTEHHEHAEHHQFHEVHHKKRVNKKNLFIFGGLILLVIVAIILLFIAFKPSQSIEKYNVSYSLELADGTSILTENSIFNEDSFSSTLGLNSKTIDSEIDSLAIGQEKTITLSAEDAFGEYDPELNMSINRTQEMERKKTIPRTITIGLSDFTDAFDEQPIVGRTYSLDSDPFQYKVLSSANDQVELSREINVGATVPNSLFPLKVTSVNITEISLEMQANNTVIPSENGNWDVTVDSKNIYLKLTPIIGQNIDFGYAGGRVVGFSTNQIYVDANVPYAGEKIIIKLKLENKFTEKIASSNQGYISGAPTMQVFIMSHCPFGTQMVKGILPVMEKFKGKANIEVRFVGYTMHGAQEDLDNNRMICVREEQNSKLIPYLECFVSNTGSEADSQKCITQVGLDKSKLDSCMDLRVAEYMKADKELNTKYGVQGSPTVILDGKEASIYPRDPTTVAKALCDAFTSNKPSECSLTFSTTNPSAGFGTGSSTSSEASCG